MRRRRRFLLGLRSRFEGRRWVRGGGGAFGLFELQKRVRVVEGGGTTYLVGDGGAFCVAVWRGMELVLERKVGAPFGKRAIEALKGWRRGTSCSRCYLAFTNTRHWPISAVIVLQCWSTTRTRNSPPRNSAEFKHLTSEYHSKYKHVYRRLAILTSRCPQASRR